MEDLLTHPDVKHLMLIGAYRDKEVAPTHPLMRKLEAMRQAGAIVHHIVLAPLAREDLRQLVADSLHCEPEHAEPLAKLIHDKTAGNPFFCEWYLRTWNWSVVAISDEDIDRAHENRVGCHCYTQILTMLPFTMQSTQGWPTLPSGQRAIAGL